MKGAFCGLVWAARGIGWTLFVSGLMLIYIFIGSRIDGMFPAFPALIRFSDAIADRLPSLDGTHETRDDLYMVLVAFVAVVPLVIAGRLSWLFRRRWLALLSEGLRTRIVQLYRTLWKRNRGVRYLVRGVVAGIQIVSLTIAYFVAWALTADLFPDYRVLRPAADKVMDWLAWSDRTPEDRDAVYALLVSFVTVALVAGMVKLLGRCRRRAAACPRRDDRP
ncbi:hypothetical protein K6W16_11880 [Burkholderia dolosa]|uniref:Uncharacterized protein n=1 Tax=Burkholderia dolosa TaxID=152500 RepID=A0A892I9M6_9BURK|nr:MULTISPECIES: hypothetical protein [Burkholderia]AKE02215.1 hypothetical protein XM57_04165 [Burkholderia cepacia]AJY12976.1 putative dTDP-4-dehydrorhamnose 3,5-epimerase [Burkholderia dolosa AU0158]AYZ96956.1 hypothetical protein EGY28_17865 [Burkholderia dolosa]ETP66716.1 hypothetical protein BDSB_00615 [Burkholderia dolosa PC543]MBR8419153.1 hypothetical protein [Burkholderia dolosa]